MIDVSSKLEQTFRRVFNLPAVIVEDDAYIGTKATILPNVRVGCMATVAANTLVTADVPPRGVVIGVPGRVIMIRPAEEACPTRTRRSSEEDVVGGE